MKKFKRVIIIIVFIILIIFIVFNLYSNIKIKRDLEGIIYSLSNITSGEYIYKDRVIYSSSGKVIGSNYNINGNGKLYIDKYGNVKIYINNSNKCVYKNSLGSIKIKKSCDDFDTLNIKMNRNNNQVSFINSANLKYMISNEDNLNGKWTYLDSDLILSIYDSEVKYLWFKDSDGNLSDLYKFNVQCFDSDGSMYDENTYYCNGSSIKLDNIEWVVIDNDDEYLTLMKRMPISIKLSHCGNGNNYCYYNESGISNYSWSNSYINYYLNNVYINTLSDTIVNRLVLEDICDVSTNISCDNNDGCGGYLKSEIDNFNYSCNKYTSSYIRLITYNEYNNIYKSMSNINLINGNYWMMNGNYLYGFSVQKSYDIYIKENLNSLLDIKPVIKIKR